MLKTIITPWRLKWYPAAFLSAIFLAFIICMISGSSARILSGRLGGDYPAFYAAGRIVASGDSKELYNIACQHKAQQGLFPDEPNAYLPFAYPPYAALFFAPLSKLPYRLSYFTYTMISVSALIVTMKLMQNVNHHIERYFLPLLTLAITFNPILSSIFKGQNTTISLLLIGLAWTSILRDRPYLAGGWLGLLLFKPQFAVPLIGLFILSGRWRVAIGSAVVAVVLYLIGAFMIGRFWLAEWVNFVTWFSAADASINSANAISWLGFFQSVLGASNLSGLSIGWSLSLVTILWVSCVWFKGGKKADFNAQMGIACVSLVLISPHVMVYDVGLCIFTYIVIFRDRTKWTGAILVAVWMAGYAHHLRDYTGFTPLFFIAGFTLLLAVLCLRHSALGRPPISRRTF